MKELEGKEVYLRPTGNNARRHDKNKTIKAKVIKVARVFITIVIDNHYHEQKLRINGKSINNDHNGGYVVYESEKELSDYYESSDVASKIARKYRYESDYKCIGLEKLKAIASILDIPLK